MAVKAVKAPSSSSLNPNAPHFVPSYFESVEDFSSEWWVLVKASPAFRDYWIRERWEALGAGDSVLDQHLPADEEDIIDYEAAEVVEDEEAPFDEADFDIVEVETLKEQATDAKKSPRSPGASSSRLLKALDLVTSSSSVCVVEHVPREARHKVFQIPTKRAEAQMRKNSLGCRIQQPR